MKTVVVVFYFLQDMSELNKLEVLPSLTELSVVGNPVSTGITGF